MAITLTKVTVTKAAEVCKALPLGDKARELLRDPLTPAQYLQLLMDNQQYLDAVRFLAHALPRREAVWWACLCARSSSGPNSAPAVRAALQAAEKWVADPTEDNRRPSMAAAEAATLETPAGCAAAAAFWSGGSLAPPNLPEVPPPEGLTARGVTGAILLAAVFTEPEKAIEKQRTFLTQGIDVANGTNRWKEPIKR
ncbi:MAG: hypothetical protein L0Z62_16770 [Gemmataceae bacterium]|nr:hypothetical protein [Gemmataceae bacterium]